eukprot:TRINITY_DN2382_c0_g3_i1.p1 TRINITY_DN2382_c0_g3~~TRINITY_DN2382_c0_g3_i1.p1  ORF type:complete len:329 (+),score=45.36 TRINITY_DN2382_c0_g3_i1:53-1039(+)
MCWNAPVAGVFASLETLVLLVMILRTRSPWFKWLNGSANVDSMQRRDNLILPMLMTINIVEWCELGLWLADPEPFPAEGCRRVNTALTHIAGGVVWLQPTFTMIYCRFTGPPNQRPWFTIPLVLAVMTSAGYFISVALGESGKAVYADDERYPTALMWNQTCAYVGPNGYLEWRFKLANLPVLPSMFSYHLFFNFALMFHCFPMGAFVGGGSVFVLCVQFLSMDGSGEAWSMWCWSGCLFIGFYFIANYVDTDTMVIYQGFEPSDPCTQCLPCICPFVEVKDEDAESNASSEAVIDEEAGGHDGACCPEGGAKCLSTEPVTSPPGRLG